MNPEDKATKRSWPWGVRLLLSVLGVAVVGAAIVFLMGVAATARWDRYAATLRAGGDPLTFKEIQAARAVIPDDQNGALVIERLLFRLNGLSDTHTGEHVLVFPNRVDKTDFFTGIRRDKIQPSRDFLDPYRDLLAELSVLKDMPTGRFELTYDPASESIMSVPLPELSAMRTASKLQYLHGVLENLEGDLAGAADSARVQLAIGATLNEHPTVIGRLVQMAVDALGLRALENLLRAGELDDETLQQFLRIMRQRSEGLTMRWAFAGERAFLLGVCDEYTESPQARGRANAMVGGAILGIMPDALIRENQMRGVEMLTWLVDAKDDPTELVAGARRIDTEAPKLTVMHGLVKRILPSLSRSVTLHLRITAHFDCTIAALAAERYRLANGKLPESLDALVPMYLDEVPTDPFDGEPMRFAKTDEGIVIYSINEDLSDDGGAVTKPKKYHRPLDTGFRLNRPEHRGLKLIDPPPEDDE